jgi:hypothetical protein
MPEKNILELKGFKEILRCPDGSYKIETLEKILSEAISNNINQDNLIVIISDQRVKNFNPDNPEWENTKERVHLRELFEIYKQIEGRDYREPTFEEAEGKRCKRIEFKY